MVALRQTRHVRSTVATARPLGPPRVHAAGSACIDHDATTLPLIAIGDAVSCFDPVSGHGIVKALRSGVFASYAVADFLRRGDATGLERYRALMTAEFATYRQTLADFYGLERRWAERSFWKRRDAPEANASAAQRTRWPN
jgi:hypothetical protein